MIYDLSLFCEADFQNQGAQELAKVHDPQGKRTIGKFAIPMRIAYRLTLFLLGVLTKPDRIPKGDENSWTALIRNEKEPLENGWFCVKQPDSNALKHGITWKDARKKEEAFFAHNHPWSSLERSYQRNLGTSNLTDRLSNILSDLIAKRSALSF